jgi:hypothetical protein
VENTASIILPIEKNLLYYIMKKAFEKAMKVIKSCKNLVQTMSAFNYIWNFNRLFEDKKGCAELTKKLRVKCTKKRRILEII